MSKADVLLQQLKKSQKEYSSWRSVKTLTKRRSINLKLLEMAKLVINEQVCYLHSCQTKRTIEPIQLN